MTLEVERLDHCVLTVQDLDATAIFYFDRLEGGTENTLAFCIEHRRPYKLIDAMEIDSARAGQLVWDFVVAAGVGVLNVAGPRASKQPQGHRYARLAIGGALRIGGAGA